MLSLRCFSIVNFSIASLCTLGLTACNTTPSQVFSGLDPTPSEAITSIQRKPDGESTVIAGKVGTIAPLIGQVAFEVQDETGVVWVLSDRQAPETNSQVKIHGVIRTKLGERYVDQK